MNRLRIPAIVFLLVIGVTAQQANDRQLRIAQRRANAGDVVAQLELGERFANGRGVPKDDAQAFQWNLRAAQAGNATGELRVGVAYALGRGVARDYDQAFSWMQRASDQQNITATAHLGELYIMGWGVKPDPGKGFALVSKAAAAGDAEGQFYAGLAYRDGEGVDRNPSLAFQYLSRSARQYNTRAMVNLAGLSEQGIGVSQDAAQALALYREAGERGNGRGFAEAGRMYRAGVGVDRNVIVALQYFQKSGKDPLAITQLGEMFRDGDGVQADPPRAARLFRQAADLDYTPAERELAEAYLNGDLGLTRDRTEAVRLLRAASSKNDDAASQRLIQLGERSPDRGPLSRSEIEDLLTGGVANKRIVALVEQFGVSFSLDNDSQQILRSDGAQPDLLDAIARNKR